MATDPLDKWFSDVEYGSDWQAVDYILAHVELLPKMQSYLDRIDGSLEKKCDIIGALLLLLTWKERAARGHDLKEIVRIIKTHSEIATRALPSIGLVEETLLRRILGL